MAEFHRSAPLLRRSSSAYIIPSDASRPLRHSFPYDRPSDARPRRLPYHPAAASPSDVSPRLHRSIPYDIPAVGSSSAGSSSNATPRLRLGTLDNPSSVASPRLHRDTSCDLSPDAPRLLRRSTPYDRPSGDPSDPLRCKAPSGYTRDRDHADHAEHDDMKCETEIVDHSDMLKDITRMIFFTLRSCTTVWAGVFDEFSFLGSETLKTSSEKDWDFVLGHYPKYFKLNDTFYVLGAGLVSIIRTSLWVLATYISEHPDVKLTLELLVRVIRTNESFKEMQGMAEREELLTPCVDFNATLLIVQLGVGVGEVMIDHRDCNLNTHRIQGAGHGYDDAKRYLQDDVVPGYSTYEDVFAAAKNGFENAARRDYGSGGQGRFFGLYHDGRAMKRDIIRLPTYNGLPGRFTPYHPSP